MGSFFLFGASPGQAIVDDRFLRDIPRLLATAQPTISWDYIHTQANCPGPNHHHYFRNQLSELFRPPSQVQLFLPLNPSPSPGPKPRHLDLSLSPPTTGSRNKLRKTPNQKRKEKFNMITRFITEVSTKVNPFSAKSKSVRLFLNSLPSKARSEGTAISTKLLPRSTMDKNSLMVKFSTRPSLPPPLFFFLFPPALVCTSIGWSVVVGERSST